MILLRYAVHVAARQNGKFVATNTIICLCPEELLTCVWFVAELRVGLRCQILTKSVDVHHHTQTGQRQQSSFRPSGYGVQHRYIQQHHC
jgi:hypothetical protein